MLKVIRLNVFVVPDLSVKVGKQSADQGGSGVHPLIRCVQAPLQAVTLVDEPHTQGTVLICSLLPCDRPKRPATVWARFWVVVGRSSRAVQV
ncbi:hypothetical protein D3C78_1795470 [compost metagenome]